MPETGARGKPEAGPAIFTPASLPREEPDVLPAVKGHEEVLDTPPAASRQLAALWVAEGKPAVSWPGCPEEP